MSRAIVAIAICLLAAAAVGYRRGWFRQFSDHPPDELRIGRLVASEEMILKLTPSLRKLAADLRNFEFPSSEHRAFFAESFECSEPLPSGARPMIIDGVSKSGWDGGPTLKKQRETALLWQSLLEGVRFFDYASLSTEKGSFIDDTTFETVVLFSAAGRMSDGPALAMSGKINATWIRSDDSPLGWAISRWLIGELKETRTANPLFRDRLDEALPSEPHRNLARTCEHRRALSYYYKSGQTRAPFHEFAPIALTQKPAVSVVDIDGDGFDDIYLMVRLGQNILLRNQRDGTFVEEAGAWSLAIPGRSTSGIFADFDNDGDQDLMLGRSIERSAYLENRGMRFVAVEQRQPLPFLASSMAAADYNGDGLLDVYICTYRAGDLGSTAPGFDGTSEISWCDKYLGKKDAAEYRRRFEESRKTIHRGYLDQVGPSNVLLANRGEGQFERVFADDPVSPWKNTLQAVWNDYDADGDPDLFLANDWATDQLFRNDGGTRFVDVSIEAGLTAMGFGMGASWGDYDGDGMDDLYVSNMFSKAGRRILGQFAETSPAFVETAAGNFLHRQVAPGRFERVSGLEPPKLLVAKAGWSWGGQFFDFDNDRDLDIYALSGYFTVPPEFESDIDL